MCLNVVLLQSGQFCFRRLYVNVLNRISPFFCVLFLSYVIAEVPVPLKAEKRSGTEVGAPATCWLQLAPLRLGSSATFWLQLAPLRLGSLAPCWFQLAPLKLGSSDFGTGLRDTKPGFSTVGLWEFWLENGKILFNGREFRFDFRKFGFRYCDISLA